MDRLSFIWFLVRMSIFATALIIAARPDLDNPGCYRNGLDYFRLALEVITLICFIMKGYDEIREMITCVSVLRMCNTLCILLSRKSTFWTTLTIFSCLELP